jgi:hypothetical protein
MIAWAAVALTVATVFAPFASADRIEVTAKVRASNTISLPPTGRSGDATAAQWIVRDRYGNAIGDMLIDCRWVTSGLRLCVGQLALPLGTLAVLGASRTQFVGQLAVVGGTGRYVDADGTMLFKAVGTNQYVLSVTYQKE